MRIKTGMSEPELGHTLMNHEQLGRTAICSYTASRRARSEKRVDRIF